MTLPTPYYENELGRLYHADCFDILPNLEPVDLVLTDPPWNMGYFNDDCKSDDDFRKFVLDIKNASEMLSDSVAMFFSTKTIPIISSLFCGYDFLASVKNFSQMTPNKLPNCWDIVYLKYKKYNGNGRNWFISNTAGMLKYRTDHPTPRTLDVISYLIEIVSVKNQYVLDPFLGSGTTAVACERLKRKWIGIEIEEKYCAIAVKRIEAERRQLKLF